MPKLDDLVWEPHSCGDGEQALVEFENGYTASVLRGGLFHTAGGTFEMAVLRNGLLTYPSGVDDLCFLSEEEANAALGKIEALPDPEKAGG